MTRRLAGYGAAVMTTLLALVVLWQFRSILVAVLGSLVIAAALRPLVTHLSRYGVLLRVGWILIYLAVLVGLGVLLFQAGGLAVQEIQHLGSGLSGRDEWQLSFWLRGSPFEQALISRLPPPSKLLEAVAGSQGQLIPPAILNLTQSIGGALSGMLIVLILGIYWAVNQTHFERLWLSLLPPGKRIQARDIWHTIEPDIGAYLRGMLGQSLLAGLLLGAGFWLLGSPYPALLALTGALACLVPGVGLVFTLIPVLLVGLLSSVQLTTLTVLYTLIVMVALGEWVRPRLIKHRWENPTLTLLLLIALADAFGLVGILAAPLISVVCQILWSRLVNRRTAAEAAGQISDLRERQRRIWDTINTMDEPPQALVINSMERLAALIEIAEPILQSGLQAEAGQALPPIPAEPAKRGASVFKKLKGRR